MKVIKRDGHMVEYSPEKIENAILKANKDVADCEKVSSVQIRNIIKYIESLGKKRILVEDIQDIIEMKLMSIGKFTLAKKYITYRYTRELVRKSNTTDVAIKNLIGNDNEVWVDKNPNKNTKLVDVQRENLAGITSTDITRRFLLPEDIVKAHDDGILYFHNTDHFAQNAIYNSSIINLFDMLSNGCEINGIRWDIPKDFQEAVNTTIQIVNSVAVNQYGRITVSLGHIASFVVDSYKKYLKKYKKQLMSDDMASKYATEDLKEEVSFGIKSLMYGVSSLPVNIYMYLGESGQYVQERALLIEEIFRQVTEEYDVENKKIKKILFPKLIYVLEENNVFLDSKYYYLTELAINCSIKCLNPEFVSEKIFTQKDIINKDFVCINGMILLPFDFKNGDNVYGKFNQGIVTLNLVDIALSSDKEMSSFWKIFDERLELCHRALQIRHKRLSKVNSDSSPILWQFGAISRLKDGDGIHDLLHDGYSNISLGFAGLHECVKYMMGYSFYENEESREFAFKILEKLNTSCKNFGEIEKITYSVCGITDEIVSYKFASCLKDRFGEIRGITDRNYITPSHQIPDYVRVNLYDKLNLEGEMQKKIGFTSLINLEIDNIKERKEFFQTILNYVYENSLYIQMSAKIDCCLQCGYKGMLEITDDLKWKCPQCGNQDYNKINVFRRIYGNIECNDWTDKILEELKSRKLYNFDEMEGKKYEY